MRLLHELRVGFSVANDGLTVLMAAARGDLPEVVQELLEALERDGARRISMIPGASVQRVRCVRE